MLDNLKNLAGLMGQAGDMKKKMEQIQDELSRKTVEGESGAGAVRVEMNGKFEVIAVHLDRPLLQTLAGAGDETDQTMIEELIAGAFNAAHDKAQHLARDEMLKLTGGMNVAGLDQIT